MGTARFAAVACCFLALTGCGERPVDYMPPLPHPGDEAGFRVTWWLPKNREVNRHVLLRCVRVEGRRVTFHAYYPKAGNPGPPVYRVILDYGGQGMIKESRIIKRDGTNAKPEEAIGGVPVPFHYLFASARERVEYTAPFKGSKAILIRRSIPSWRHRRGWRLQAWCKKREHGKDVEIYQKQSWFEGEWIWWQLVSSADYKSAILVLRTPLELERKR